MNRFEKKDSVESLNQDFQNHEMVLVAGYKGLTVAQMSDLRGKMRASGASMRVAKNRLAKIASEGTSHNALNDLLKGPTVLAFGKDPVSVAKIANDYAKTNDKLVILGAVMGDKLLDPKSVLALSKLPTLNQLRSQLVGLLSTPATRIATVLEAPAAQLARVFSAYSQKA